MAGERNWTSLNRLLIPQKTLGSKKAFFHSPCNRKTKVSDRLCVNLAIRASLCHYASELRLFPQLCVSVNQRSEVKRSDPNALFFLEISQRRENRVFPPARTNDCLSVMTPPGEQRIIRSPRSSGGLKIRSASLTAACLSPHPSSSISSTRVIVTEPV